MRAWLEGAFESLRLQPVCGYGTGWTASVEPTALAALALIGAGRVEGALQAARWLAGAQGSDGSVGISRELFRPSWPTALATLVWCTVDRPAASFAANVRDAVAFSLALSGETSRHSSVVGHDTTLAGWPWVQGTHSWVEPTAFHILALKAAGLSEHARVREGVSLLLDRQLPGGGWNYGNTSVLGQMLRPHVQPTGVALLALMDEPEVVGRVSVSFSYLTEQLSAETTPSSLAWALMGLTGCGKRPAEADDWLNEAAERTDFRAPVGHKLTLMALAAQGEACPLISGVRQAEKGGLP